MTQSVVEVSDKLHIVTRRLFVGDLRRHFAGTVTAASGGQVRIEGYAFVFNQSSAMFRRRPELRTRIFGVADPQLIVIALPPATSIDNLRYDVDNYSGRLTLTDGSDFKLDMNEFADETMK